ncbi:helix-turn-helix transcriptional regulator [Curtobacterium sp. Leaf261]|uniref:helix-turn-helix transcriptional regulator n=1 Tax=Curtobacterium sp. Leaf261 TaxID=1736311 RepID=UPI00138F9AC5|nr:AraC family transcriptional regulator [Curtobacterium sp. Leaf261]
MVPEHDPRERFETSGTDLGVASAMFAEAYAGSDFLTRQTGAFAYRHTMVGGAGMQLRGSRFTAHISGEVEPTDDYVVQWVTRGGGVIDVGHDEVHLLRGAPTMFPTGRPYAFVLDGVDQNLVHFERRFLEREAAARAGTEVGPLHFDHTHSPTGESLRKWREAVALAARAVMVPEPPSPVLLSEIAQFTARTLLDTFPHRVLAPADRGPGGSGRVGTAIEFMHANAALGITTTDVARSVGLSVRGLQQAFQRQLGEAPNTILRGIRLDRARDDLARADPSTTTVAATARLWGFAHLGRFSGAYLARFGEYPRDTLAR